MTQRLECPYNARTTALFIDSEGDVFRNGSLIQAWKPTCEEEHICQTVWLTLMGHFRHRSRHAQGGLFSDNKKTACWLPKAFITRKGCIRGLLSTELSSKGNVFIPRQDGSDRRTVERAIDNLMAFWLPPADVLVNKREFDFGFFEIDVAIPPHKVAESVKFCILLADAITSDAVLCQAMEVIGGKI